MMEKLAFFFIDDVIWCLRDIAKERPVSLFDNPFMKMLKKAHDEYGMTVQLNLFYRTDFSYGDEEFNLTQMPDTYKDEFKSAKGWLRLAFHAKQEFPNYPYVNASYSFVKSNYEEIITEIKRFAGEECISGAIVPHCLPISREGCCALHDCGAKFLAPSSGTKYEFNGDDGTLPRDFITRMMYRRQPETTLYTKITGDGSTAPAVCAYNHITEEQNAQIINKNKSILDQGCGLRFKRLYGDSAVLNCLKLEQIEPILSRLNGHSFVGIANHEQYFYPEYSAYQPDYADKIYLLGKTLTEYGYRFITVDEME